ncbi:FxsC protein [Catellatospora citrea]|uniref:FxsC-like protein n=1 Tax=Catellatospora citrea TaxID=53366 RepID=A0A8J3NYC7_9ACTN|nr:FxsC protein [Catellatospora citrea]RKE11146.1 FxsC-like protein [Catellatospora citrea]GIF96611.1 hypothetical protein Cci01nite_17050 [Catellatospora citrea]
MTSIPRPWPQFFIGHAPADDSRLIQTFFTDLSKTVRARGGSNSSDTPGFIELGVNSDIDVPLNEGLRHRVAEAIATCGVFIPLLSRNYFANETCGREFYAFQRRPSPTPGSPAETVLPVQWGAPTAATPPELAHVELPCDDSCVEYRRVGLRTILSRLNERGYRTEYESLLNHLANLITIRCYDHPVPEPATVLDITAMPTWTHDADVPARRSADKQYVHILVVGEGRATIRQVRRIFDCYGEDVDGWTPYHPQLSVPIGDYARAVANDRGFSAGTVTLAEISLAELVEWSSDHQQAIIIVLDAWVTRLGTRRGVLREFDESPFAATGVLVPTSTTDQETTENLDMLQVSLQEVFHRRHRNPRGFQARIRTFAEFKANLERMLGITKNEILKRRNPPDGPGSGPPSFGSMR